MPYQQIHAFFLDFLTLPRAFVEVAPLRPPCAMSRAAPPREGGRWEYRVGGGRGGSCRGAIKVRLFRTTAGYFAFLLPQQVLSAPTIISVAFPKVQHQICITALVKKVRIG